MVKRILYITFVTLLVGALVYFYIQVNHHSEIKTQSNLIEILPNNPSVIMEIPKLRAITDNNGLNSEMWKTLSEITSFKSYSNIWSKWDTIITHQPDLKAWDNNPSILSYHLIGKQLFPFIAIQFSNKASERAWKTILLEKGIKKEKEYNSISIYKFDKDIAAYAYINNGLLALSSSPILLEQSIRASQTNSKTDEDFETIRKTRGNSADINIYVNYQRLYQSIEEITGKKSDFSLHLANLGKWGEFDYSIDKHNIIFNGFSSYSSENYWQIFNNQSSIKMTIQNAIPADSKGFTALSIENIKKFRKDYEAYLQHQGSFVSYQNKQQQMSKQGISNMPLLLDNIIDQEIAFRHDNILTTSNDESLIIIKTKSGSSALENIKAALSAYAKKNDKVLNDFCSTIDIDSEIKYKVYSFPFEDIFDTFYGRAFAPAKTNYVCLYDNYLIFGAERFSIKKAIMANILKQTYANDANFVDFYSSFSAKNTFFYFENGSNIIPKIQKNIGEKKCQESGINNETATNFYALAYQLVSSDNYVYNNILINYNANLRDKPQTVWSSQLDAAPMGKPQFVKNHYSKENEICIQDEQNNLYLISNSGRVIWKKPIGEKIISSICQIDYFRNGKLQLLFNTPSKLWLLDRNGNFVERYPILLPSQASTGLSLFDYDHNRDYRIFVPTIDKHIYLYNKDGNMNTGFKFGTTEYPLTMPLQFFRIGGKDYLVCTDKNHVYILNRQGKRRVKIKNQFSASPNNAFYLGKDNSYFLATTDNKGSVRKVYFDGSIKTIELPEINANHYFALEDLEKTGSNDYIIVTNNQITVYNSNGKKRYSKQIENAELSRPFFYNFATNDTKIGFVNQNKNKIYLLNGNNGELYKDFPLVGSTPFSIGFLSASAWRFNLIVGGENGALYNYKVK